GRGAALIKSGGVIRTKFIENCRAAARKTITVDSEIVNSSVFTLENVDLGEKGVILGGDIYAVKGIRAGAIGRKSGRATKIHCGIDFTVQQEKEKNNNQLRILAAKLGKLRELLAAPDTTEEKRIKIEELRQRLEGEQQKAANRVSELLGQINMDENAFVEVMGEIAPGTLVEICQVALFVTEPLKRVRLRLDKAAGKVISEPL
ncbi:MAG: FapA family protein, partial [Treponema sp.]|nr:FapA family protein [Treponema sp.]